MILKHTDDDGDLSIFATGNEILFACKKGHYWVVAASDFAKVSSTALLADDKAPQAKSNLARFGTDAIKFMKD